LLRLRSEITINETTFDAVVSVEIESTWENLTDTCKIELPNNFQRDGRNITVGDEGFFKRGDAVTVKLGYFPFLNTEFEGYIRRIAVDNIITIEVEDAAYLLKQSTITKSFKSTNLKNLLTEISPIPFEAVNAELGQLRLTRVTPAAVIEELRKIYGLVSFVRDGVLKVGLTYYDNGTQHNFDFEENIIDNGLEQGDPDDLFLTVYGSSKQDDDSVIEFFAWYENNKVNTSDKDPQKGEIEKLEIKSQISKKDLEFYTINKLEHRILTGALGDLTTFGEPSVKHGDTVNLISRKFPEREGVFLVKKVVKTFGLGGFRQTITLNTKLNK
tara:strand:+ start:5336 stop:6319 length:984 start_codon:yes stop_codon:yes gene_type:complete